MGHGFRISFGLKPLALLLAFGGASLMVSGQASAACMSLSSGPVVYDVAACKQIEPEQLFDLSKEKYQWIGGLDAAGKKKFYDSYRGLYLKGRVVKSEATQKGLSSQQGVLMGEDAYMYLPPGSNLQCGAVLGKRLAGNLREKCCDGNGDTPCLLETSYLLLGAKAIGSANSGAGDAARQKAKKSKDYVAGARAFSKKKYKDAIKHFEQAMEKGELDVKGHYWLGYSYRELDQCRDAVRPLKYVHDLQSKKQIWDDEDKVARRAVFLLARCYSKMNDPGPAVLLMNQYLLEPGKYRAELRESLRHKDFGWIHTSKEYREYKQAAEQKLRPSK